MATSYRDTGGGSRRPSRAAFLLGLGVPLGWGFHDLAVFALTSRPEDARLLLPGIFLAVVVGGVVAPLLAGSRAFAALGMLVAFAGLVTPNLFDLAGSPTKLAQPGILGVALTAWFVAWLTTPKASDPAFPSRGSRFSPMRWGIAAGALGAALNTGLRVGPEQVSGAVVAGSLLLLVAAHMHGVVRGVATLVAIGLPMLLVTREAGRISALGRPDLAPPTERAAADAPSALLVVLDTVRADRMSAYGYGRDTTPGLDAFARNEATRYDAARSSGAWTLPSHATLFSGLFPAEHGMTHPRESAPEGSGGSAEWGRPYPLRPGTRLMAERLRERGYRTAAIVANNMMGSWAGLDAGFERYDDRKSCHVRWYAALAQVGWGRELIGHKPYRDARQITDLALEWLDGIGEDEPYFLMLNYMDAHNPYAPPPPYDALFSDERPVNPLRAEEIELFPLQYDRELAFLDAEVTRLLEELRERGRYDGSLIVITSDHGEAFGEHETWIHDWVLYDELVRVPLFVKPAGGRRESVVTRPFTGPDVHDLVLRELGVPVARSTQASDGFAAEWYYNDAVLLDPRLPGLSRPELARHLVAWVTEDHRKVIVTSTGEVEAYDLRSDPEERRPVELPEAEQRVYLERARAWWAAHPPPERRGDAVDADTVDVLRDLGYAGGDEAP